MSLPLVRARELASTCSYTVLRRAPETANLRALSGFISGHRAHMRIPIHRVASETPFPIRFRLFSAQDERKPTGYVQLMPHLPFPLSLKGSICSERMHRWRPLKLSGADQESVFFGVRLRVHKPQNAPDHQTRRCSPNPTHETHQPETRR